ncbi:MAG: hypothetical protein MUO82_05115 [Candidatus Thermoplasmatota archaeon]|nr:hypothetical protein [Candidatus Thermoplasmatota archaeon]
MKNSIVVILVLTFMLIPVLSVNANIDQKPELEIVEIKGGIGLTVLIKNVGTADATHVAYHLEHGGGFFLRTKEWDMDLPDISVGETYTLKTGFVRYGIGLGIITSMPWITISIRAHDADIITENVSVKTFGALVILQ